MKQRWSDEDATLGSSNSGKHITDYADTIKRRYSKPRDQSTNVIMVTLILIAALYIYDSVRTSASLPESIGQFYVMLAVIGFSVQLVWLAMVGVRMVLFDAARGREEAMRDVQLGLASRADIVRAEVKANLMKADED